MKIIIAALIILAPVFTSAQKDIQKRYFVFDMGLSYSGAINFATSKDLIPKVGYTTSIYLEHQFNNGKSFKIGTGTSLEGFSLDTRFKNVLHVFNINLPILYGKQYKSGKRFYSGIVPSYCVRSDYSEILFTLTPRPLDVKLHFEYDFPINKFIGIDIAAQLGVINLGVFGSGHVSNWNVSSKFYLRLMTKRKEQFLAGYH